MSLRIFILVLLGLTTQASCVKNGTKRPEPSEDRRRRSAEPPTARAPDGFDDPSDVLGPLRRPRRNASLDSTASVEAARRCASFNYDSDSGASTSAGSLRIPARNSTGQTDLPGSAEFSRLFPNANLGDLDNAQSFFMIGLFRQIAGPFQIGVHRHGGVVVRHGNCAAWCRPKEPPPGGFRPETPLGERFMISDYDAATGELVHEWTDQEVNDGMEDSGSDEEAAGEAAPAAPREGQEEQSPE